MSKTLKHKPKPKSKTKKLNQFLKQDLNQNLKQNKTGKGLTDLVKLLPNNTPKVIDEISQQINMELIKRHNKELTSITPESFIIKLGPRKSNPDISWTQIKNIAKETYSPADRTLISLMKGVELLEKYKLE